MNKRFFIFVCFIILLVGTTNSATISVYPNFLYLPYRQDTLYIKNIGSTDLFIDSIKTVSKMCNYAYYVWIQTSDSLLEWNCERIRLTIIPNDSVKFIFFPLCIIRVNELFTDSLYIFSNDTLHSPWRVFILGEFSLGVSKNNTQELLKNFETYQNYPNPFNLKTTISFVLSKDEHTTLKIYDITGRLVKALINEHKTAGYYSVKWNGQNEKGEIVPSGLYLYQITSGNYSSTKRMLLLK